LTASLIDDLDLDFSCRHMEHVMIALSLPLISITSIDILRLKQVTDNAVYGFHPAGTFLRSEIDRASIHPPSTIPDCVRLDEWVDFRPDDGEPMRSAILVMPAKFWSDRRHVSILSPVGAALIGLRAGDRMPYTDGIGKSCTLSVIRVRAPDVTLLTARKSKEWRTSRYDGPPDGPEAA
jgi:regulator of nucleoside diphosphate kinase